ncbi:MAG: ankyrin repeat domain-containing protein [Treponemataceae bacterium]|nr:ankyrin repeat domain-containing protein [Treponemataceae bacterium]
MDWMILTDIKDSENIFPVTKFLEKNDVKPVIFNVSDDSCDRMEVLCRLLIKTTHCILITEDEKSFKNNMYLIYAVGFLSGRNIPAFVPKKIKAVNPCVMEDFTSFETIAKLVSKLKNNYPEYLKEESKKYAHRKLFDDGIPFTPDSFSFHIAKANEKICELFVEAGMDVNCRDSAGTPMICIAARSGRKKMIEWLLSLGADINSISKDRGYSAVMDAVWKSSLDIVKLLVEKGANLNYIANDGQTAIIVATGASNPLICELLVKNGADPEYKDRMGMSALDYAQLFKKNELVKLYKEYVK